MNAGFAFAIAGLATVALVPVAIRIARRFGVLDHPNHRSSHRVAVPRGGGAALVIPALVVAAVAARSDEDEERPDGMESAEMPTRPPVVEDDVNEEILERYIRSLGPARFATIRGLLRDSAQEGLPRLTAVDTPDEEIEDIAHRLAGAASHFGLTAFVGLMRAVEDGMREGRRAEAQELAATAESAFSRGLAAMDTVRGVLEGV